MSGTTILLSGEDKGSAMSCSSISKSPYYNIFLLSMAWALTLTTSTLLTTLGPLSAVHLGASNSLAAFTIGCFLLGAAFSSVPSGWLFRTYGRLMGFFLGCVFQLIGSVLCSLAMVVTDLTMLYLGCFAIGLGQGIGQFYRFSAVEVAPVELKSRAVTYVLSGGIFAAFLGPTIANRGKTMLSTAYLGSYILIAVIAIVNIVVILMVNFPKITLNPSRSQSRSVDSAASGSTVGSPGEGIRSTYEIITQPLFIISCTIATLAHTIMVMVMSNVTVDMTDHGFSFEACALVMEVHFFAMFVPGFFSGMLIEKQGTFVVSIIGGVIFAASSFVLGVDDQEWNFMLGMVLLGVAWNFSFSAGTIMLTHCYRPIEATEVQAVNDFILFTVAGGGSLASGYIYAEYGWLVLIYVSSALMVGYLLLFTFVWIFAVPTAAPEEKSLFDATLDDNSAVIGSDADPARRSGSSIRSPSSDVLRGGRGPSFAFGSMSEARDTKQSGSGRGFSFSGNGPRGSSFAYEPVSDDPEHESQKQVRSMSVV